MASPANGAVNKQVPRPRNPLPSLTLDQLSPDPLLASAEACSMSQGGGRLHNKKAGIRAAVILIGLLHRSRKAKEREREREESEGWVKVVPSVVRSGRQACWVDAACIPLPR